MNEPTKKPPASGTDFWPEEIRLVKSKSRLDIRFDNGKSFSLSAELLRVESPSAEVQGHGPGQKTTPVGKRDILIKSIEPVIMPSVLVSVMVIIPVFSAGTRYMITAFAMMN